MSTMNALCTAITLTVMLYIAVQFVQADSDTVDLKIDQAEVHPDKQDYAKDSYVDPAKLDYAKGSVCSYCSHCQFCALCDKDCPCETSTTKPNCKMCKYCKYCHLCSAVCDTVCTPGGILDRVSGTIVNSLPSVNTAEVDSDIDSVKHWITQKKDEL